MDDDGDRDQRQKELSISLAASSMISRSDMISEEAYHANLKRIQEVKEMVRTLEANNESAHKNYVVHQLEKRAKDGRDAEIMLAQFRNQHSGTTQFTNNIPTNKPEVILPTTATLVEVPESHSCSYSSPATTTTSQNIQHARPAEYHWRLPTPVHQIQSGPNVVPYYTPVLQPQYSAVSRSQAPIDGQMGRYATQNVPQQSRAHNPQANLPDFQQIPVQHASHPWSSYSSPVVALPAAESVSGYYASPPGWITAAPTHSGPATGPFSPTHSAKGFQTQFTGSRPPVATHKQPQNITSLSATTHVQVPPHGVHVPWMNVAPVPLRPAPSHPMPVESQSRPLSVSKPVVVSESQRLHRQPQPQHHEQQSHPLHQPQPQSQPPPQQQLQLPQPQPQSQRLPQLPLQPPRQFQQSQPPQTHLQVSAQSTVPSTRVPQPLSEPSQSRDSLPGKASPGVSQTQPPQPTTVQEPRGAQFREGQATFIKLFQIAVQRGIPHLKALFIQAKASGISDEWFRAAISSLPPTVWESVVAQVNQSGPTHDVPLAPAHVSQQHSTIAASNVPVVSARPSPSAPPLVQTMSATHQLATPSTSTEGSSAPSASGQTSGSYAAQLQYYAEQATKSALSAQASNISETSSGNIPPIQNIVATPTRDASQARVNVRAPKDANKSTLARDILRSLGKIPFQEMGAEPTDKANNHEGVQLPEVDTAEPVSDMASPKHPIVNPATSVVSANSPPITSAEPNVQAEPQDVAPPDQSTAKSVLQNDRGRATVVEGAIMIDLTLEDSDDGKGQEPEPTFLIQTSASAATSPHPVSPANTTNYTPNHTPLLENLSLEESRVDIVSDGDNADVRMYSPPLSLAPEENMESEFLYLPPGSAELVSSSFEPLPHEASEHPLDGQLPLFLPSPPLSPTHTEPPETDLEVMSNDEGKNGPFLKRRSVDVDEMEIDATPLSPPRVKKRRKLQVYVLIPPAPSYVKKAIKRIREHTIEKDMDSDLEGAGEDEEIQYSHLEQLLIEESKSRLLERRCRWLNCGAVLNCTDNLFAHLKNHAREEDSQSPFHCHWASCQRRFDMEEERDVHLEKHTIRPLPCPFAGCDEQFNKPVEVMQHEVQHQKAEHREPLMRKSAHRPIVPAIPARLGLPPNRLPSHRVIPRRVVKCRISADRHATMGPWILWNIFSPVDLNMRKQNASMRGRQTRQTTNYDIDSLNPRRDDYDFLVAHSSYSAKNTQLDDLDSALITMSAARGLTLWGSGSAVNSPAGTATPEEYPNAGAAVPTLGEETQGEGKSDESEGATTARRVEELRSGQSGVMGEEDAVERMLIL